MRQLKTTFILLALLLLVACGQEAAKPADEATEAPQAGATEAVAVAPTEEPTSSPPTPTLVPATETPSPTEAPVEPPPPTEAPVAVASSCVSCHNSQQLLIDTASPIIEEEESGESSGVG